MASPRPGWTGEPVAGDPDRVAELEREIAPKMPVPPSAEDYFSGRDAALEAALAAPLCGAEG